jgi:hypothetical protein
LAPLSLNEASLLVQLLLQFGDQPIGTKLKSGLHLIAFSHGGFGDLARLKCFILGLPCF